MTIIIAGSIDMAPENVAGALATGEPLITGAKTQDGCLNYEWTADPATPGRIWVYERWSGEQALSNHFQNQWYLRMRDELGGFGITGTDIQKYRVDAEESVYDETMTPRADFFTV